MASGQLNLPPPPPLEIHDANAFEKWKKFELAWTNYALATELTEKPEAVQVATLLTVIGEEARDVFPTFTGWAKAGDARKIGPVLAKFANYCQPRKNIPFERYKFNRRTQEAGKSYDQYRTALRKLAEGCAFETITPDEIIRDRLVFGIRDDKVRERLLREANLTLTKTDEIARAAETMLFQMKIVNDNATPTVHAVTPRRPPRRQQLATTTESGSKRPGSSLVRSFPKECGNCGKTHDLEKKRRIAQRMASRPQIHVTEPEEIFSISEVAAVSLDDSQLVTLKLDSGNYLRFQPDTGAQCNVIPVNLYKKAAKDHKPAHVQSINSAIVAYGGTKLPTVGQVRIRVWRGDYKCLLDCKLVESSAIRPLLGRKACIGMKIIRYTDNDEINKPATGCAPVYAVNNASNQALPTAISKEDLVKKFPNVFGEGVGQLDGEYRIRLDETADPVQHAPGRVPVALREQLKQTLDDLEQQEIVAPVTAPTTWVNSMVVVPKKNGKLRNCLDPKDLNCAIKREHYPLPTIEDIATRLHGAKVFTKLDVRSGFWHVNLYEKSSYLTTFNTPFERYRWMRMPFGISSAPVVFQRKMHQLIEGLHGVEA